VVTEGAFLVNFVKFFFILLYRYKLKVVPGLSNAFLFALATFIAAVCNKTGNCSAVWNKPPCTHIFFRSRSNLFLLQEGGGM
jgi:hypothetical protein